MLPIPRFRGNAVESNGKWGWELFVTFIGDNNDDALAFSSNKSYETKELSLKSMKIAIQDIMKTLSESHPEIGIDPNQFIDLKTNSTRRFDEKDQH